MAAATASSRFIRVGLIGLDAALNSATRWQLGEQEAAGFLFAEIEAQNYVPPGCAEQYREALLAAWRTCCDSCGQPHALVIGLLDRLGIAADLEQIHDPDDRRQAEKRRPPAVASPKWLREAA